MHEVTGALWLFFKAVGSNVPIICKNINSRMFHMVVCGKQEAVESAGEIFKIVLERCIGACDDNSHIQKRS